MGVPVEAGPASLRSGGADVWKALASRLRRISSITVPISSLASLMPCMKAGRSSAVPVGDAVDAVLADQGQGVGEDVERNGKPAAFQAHHEFVFLEFVFAVLEDGHWLGSS